LVLAEGLSMGQVWKLAVRESVDRRLGRFSWRILAVRSRC
jgi:hypothetical protein